MSYSQQIRHVINVREHERVLNNAINYAQKGCTMQMWGIITLTPEIAITKSALVDQSHKMSPFPPYTCCLTRKCLVLVQSSFLLWKIKDLIG